MTAHKHPVAPVPTAGRPLTAAGTNPTMPCRECEGEGTGEYMALDETDYHVRRCHVCDGTGQEAPYCETCGETLKADGFCVPCDDWGSLVYVERISPTRIAL